MTFRPRCLAVCLMAWACAAQAIEVNLGISRWTYDEPQIAVHHEGWLPTLDLVWRPFMLDDEAKRWRLGASVAAGLSDYTGSGTIHGQEVLATHLSLAYDMQLLDTGWSWAPLLAFDRLDNDARGMSSSGARGYRRMNQRWSAGIEWWSPSADDWQWQAGWNRMLRGWQSSSLADIGEDFVGLPPTVNVQRQGWGAMLGVCRSLSELRWCAKWQTWHIQPSDAARVQTLNGSYAVHEPANRSNLISVTLQRQFD